jgi:hypothetical protein
MSIDLTVLSDVRSVFTLGDSGLFIGDFLVLFSVVLKVQIHIQLFQKARFFQQCF